MDLSINNVINISVSASQAGLGAYNTSNLALFTREPYAASFGSDGYKIYLGPTEVGTDFGTDSVTYKQALAVFSQQPNILLGGGYLVVISRIVNKTVIFDGVAVSGQYKLSNGGETSGFLQFDDDAATIQTALRLVPGMETVTVTGAAQNYVINGAVGLITVSENDMVDGGAAPVTPVIAAGAADETVGEAVTRTDGLIQYFGAISEELVSEADGLAAAAVVQPLKKILAVASRTEADVDPGGYLDLLRTGTFTHTRGLYYDNGATDDEQAAIFAASYMGRGLSTNFSGSNTTQTMHLKDLSGVQPDSTMDQTLLNKCQAAGADVYASIQGVPKTFTSGENEFFDDVYNLLWYVGALEVAGFNYLAQTGTKIPQTEAGMDGLKGSYRNVTEQGVNNQFIAPGSWTNPTTFGNQEDLYAGIEQRGYYIYSTPVAQQNPADRAARDATLVQIAVKYAGAIHSSTVIVNINK